MAAETKGRCLGSLTRDDNAQSGRRENRKATGHVGTFGRDFETTSGDYWVSCAFLGLFCLSMFFFFLLSLLLLRKEEKTVKNVNDS